MSDWRKTAPRIVVDGATWIVRPAPPPHTRDDGTIYQAQPTVYRHEDRRYTPVPIQRLRDEYSAESPLWAFLREHGVRRPSPSGTRQANTERRRKVVPVSLSDAARERLDEIAPEYGSRSAAVESLIMAAPGRPKQ